MSIMPNPPALGDASCRTLGLNAENGILSAGFLHRTGELMRTSPNGIPYYTGLLVLEGAGEYIGTDGITRPIRAGNFVQRMPGKRHIINVSKDKPWVECFITIGAGLFQTLVGLKVLDDTRDLLQPGIHPGIEDEFAAFERALAVSPERELSMMLCRAQQILAMIYKMDYLHHSADPNRFLIDRVCERLSDPVDSHLLLEDIANEFGMGYENFRKWFRKNTGVSPGQYRIKRRIETARALLLTTRESVSRIAEQLGFPDAFTFSHQFRHETGISPSAYRTGGH